MPNQADAEAALTAPLEPGACLHHCNRALSYFNDVSDTGDLVVCQGVCVSAGTRYLHCWIERSAGSERSVLDLTQPRRCFPTHDYYERFEVADVRRYGFMELMVLMAGGVTFWGFEDTDAVSVPVP